MKEVFLTVRGIQVRLTIPETGSPRVDIKTKLPLSKEQARDFCAQLFKYLEAEGFVEPPEKNDGDDENLLGIS